MDELSELNPAIEQESTEEAVAATENAPIPIAEPPLQEESAPMDVDESFEDALDSVINQEVDDLQEQPPTEEKPVEEITETENVPEPTPEPVPSVEEVAAIVTEKDESLQNSPHAMEMHDVPEHDQDSSHQEDPDASVVASEKSMEVTMLSSSAIDPFDAVKTTNANESSIDNKDASMNETAANETELDATNDNNGANEEMDTSEIVSREDDKVQDRDEESQDKDDENLDKDDENLDKDDDNDKDDENLDKDDDNLDKDDDASQLKDTEDVPDGEFDFSI